MESHTDDHMVTEPEKGQELEGSSINRHTQTYLHSDGSRVWRGSLPLIFALQKFLNLGQHCGAQVQLPQGARETAGYDVISRP